MESPFADYTGTGDHIEHEVHYEILFETPFTDVTYQQDQPGVVTETDPVLLQEVHKTGDVTLTVADPGKANSGEYRELVPSGNPLLIITKSDRQLRISANFTVGEFAQAQAGKYKFDFARIDPDLVRNLQALRTFIGKPINILDGYYSPAYLGNVLGIKDQKSISANPHISGRGVKMAVKGYDRMIKQLGIAALVACDRNINLGIGVSTMTLYVKQELSKEYTGRKDEDFQRIVSYVSDERTKIEIAKFCVDVKRLLHDHIEAYRQEMERAVSAFAVVILKIYYKQEVPAEWMDWEKPLGNVVSLMHSKSETQHPDVILYCLAYSEFGSLYRNFLKNKKESETIDYLVNELTSESDRQKRFVKGSFLANRMEPDKTNFIDNCRQRIIIGKPDKSSYKVSVNSFFDWMHHPQDKIFKDKLSEFIKKVYSDGKLIYNVPAQKSPVGGTKSNLTLSTADPDKPVTDFTGRYWTTKSGQENILMGLYYLINQAGNYISGKTVAVYKQSAPPLRSTIKEFYGKVDEKGNGICTIYPQKILILKKQQNNMVAYLVDGPSDKIVLTSPATLVDAKPVISNLIMNSFSAGSRQLQDLMLIMAWIYPPAEKLKEFFESFKKTEPELKAAITGYFNSNETVPSHKRTELNGFIRQLDYSINNYLKLPPMFQAFANYYIKFVYSSIVQWTPRNDKETMSLLDWIRKMMEDYRDFRGPDYIEKEYKRLYDYIGVDTKIPETNYRYEVKLKLTAFGIGPFARSSGEIFIENKTDYNKYPKASKWSSETYPIVLWNATLSLNPIKWTPKIAAGQTIEAAVNTSAYYSATDFSGAEIQVTEGKVFELPLSGTSGGVKVGTKMGIGGVVILVDGHGKKTLEFIKDLELSPPDTIEVEPDVSPGSEGLYEKIAEMLPSLTMYKGYINTKKTGLDMSSIPLPGQFESTYQLKDTRFFMHDDATLTAQAIEAIGRLCAEELTAFSDSASEIEIYGHADASGKPDYNLKLSRTRAMNVLQAIKDRLGKKLQAKVKKVEGLGEEDANNLFGEYTQKNAWLRRVVVIINGRAVLTLGEI
jgi:outer membrane protein OmpA-like peptidoglycan-associated protein